MAELERQLARFEKLPEPNAEEAARLGEMIFGGGSIEALVAERDGVIEGHSDLLGGPRLLVPGAAFPLPGGPRRLRDRPLGGDR